jgi:hypothetical protein
MAAMDTFDHVLNWKLKAGSHRFPGSDGGTCINEAALVAAGFPYKPIHFARQMPPCFSRPICRFAMYLNDMADDEERQRLLPYVTRLACADSREVEKAREAYIRRHLWSCYAGSYLSEMPPLSFDKGLAVLEGALAIGRQADPLGPEEVQARMQAARVGQGRPGKAKAQASDLGKHFFSKARNWLTTKETEPAG